MNINEMRTERAALWESMKNFLEKHRRQNGTLTAEDDNTYSAMEADLESRTRAIEIEERAQRTEDMMNSPVHAPITTRPGDGRDNMRASDEYHKAFKAGLRTGFTNALQVGTDSEGGYLVPEEFERGVVAGMDAWCGIRSICRKVKTSGTHNIPILSTKTVATWVAEEGTIGSGMTEPAFGNKTLGAHKCGALVKVSCELLKDAAFDVEGFLRDEFIRANGTLEEGAFVSGDGSGKPTGFLASSGGGTVGVTGASVSAIAANEILDLFYALKAPYRKKAHFVMNDDVIKAVRKLQDQNHQYMWVPGLREGEADTLLGRPIVSSDAMPTIAANAKTIAFGDFSYYWIGDRDGFEMQRLNELYAATGQIGFIGTQRVDGLLTIGEAVQIYQHPAN